MSNVILNIYIQNVIQLSKTKRKKLQFCLTHNEETKTNKDILLTHFQKEKEIKT